jgi:3-methyladenine DNA glycosylase AlkD
MNQEEVVLKIRRELKSKVEPKYKEGVCRYFKEQVKPIGVRFPVVGKITDKYFKLLKNEWKYEDFVNLSEKLLKDGYLEENAIAFGLMDCLNKQFTEESFYLFEGWLKKYVSNWANCDHLSNHLIGDVVVKYPKFIKNLLEWTKSNNRWVRRSSAVSLIIPAKNGLFLKEVFRIAEKLMQDDDDMVQKGVGWLLKEASRKHEKEVVKFLLKWKPKTSRLVLRYATEKVSKSNRKLVLR